MISAVVDVISPLGGNLATSAAGGEATVVKLELGWYNGYIHRGAVSSESNLNCDSHCSLVLSESLVDPGLWYLSPKIISSRSVRS